MILQALNDYYDRRTEAGAELPEFGFEEQTISFRLVIDRDGRLVSIDDLREWKGKKAVGKVFVLPASCGRTVNVEAHPLWDNVEYVFGIPLKNTSKRVADQCNRFYGRVQDVFAGEGIDPGIAALLKFGDSLPEIVQGRGFKLPEGLDDKVWVTFWFEDDEFPIAQRPAVLDSWRRFVSGREPNGTCLVAGQAAYIPETHAKISGVSHANSTGAALVSFNKPAFLSFGKDQNRTAPVGEAAAFKYVTAINALLAERRQRVQVGDATTVFWAEKACGAQFESAFLDFLSSQPDNPDAGTQAVASLYRSVRDGRPFTPDDSQRFYVLGLSPNAARIAVRFWHVAPIAELGRAFGRYFDEIEILRPAFDATAPLTLFRLLTATALLGKAENIPPNLGGDVMRAVLTGGRYPETLLQGALRRIRAERDVTWVRAALLKAYLIRNHDKEITVSLNEENTDPGYRLGRLFAALERVQERAQGNLNASIRERYYGAFSATPVTVLPLLMKLKNHHLAKLPNRGEAVNLEKLFSSIVDGLDAVPPRLTLAEQAQLAVGYYHQRQAFFNKSEAETPDQSVE